MAGKPGPITLVRSQTRWLSVEGFQEPFPVVRHRLRVSPSPIRTLPREFRWARGKDEGIKVVCLERIHELVKRTIWGSTEYGSGEVAKPRRNELLSLAQARSPWSPPPREATLRDGPSLP